MKKLILFITMIFIITTSASAESDFDKWKKKQKKAFDSFMSEQEKAFSDMLKKEWEEFQTQSGFIVDLSPKPEAQPVIRETEDESSKPEKSITLKPVPDKKQMPDKKPEASEKTLKKSVSAESSLPDKNKQVLSPEEKTVTAETPSIIPEKVVPAPVKKSGFKYMDIDFYGTELSVPVKSALKIKAETKKVSNKSISAFFEYYSGDKMTGTVEYIQKLQNEYGMNGWSVMKAADKISGKLYKNSTRDKMLMMWFLLIKSGYDVKIAYSTWNIYLLYLPETKIYSTPFITEKNRNYYFYNKSDSKNERIKTYKGTLVKKPQTVILKPANPDFFKTSTQLRKASFKYNRKNYNINLEYNSSLIRYYSEYPQVDISYYFRKNISDKALLSYKKNLYPYIKDKSEKEAVQFILSFIQNGFKYKTDDRQFGYEKPMFPDEAIHYPYIDCEDRSALFISIIKELTALDAVALDYPGHISAAVNFTENVKGDSVKYKGKRYVICDPTYINADVGMNMPDFKKVKPVIIETGR